MQIVPDLSMLFDDHPKLSRWLRRQPNCPEGVVTVTMWLPITVNNIIMSNRSWDELENLQWQDIKVEFFFWELLK